MQEVIEVIAGGSKARRIRPDPHGELICLIDLPFGQSPLILNKGFARAVGIGARMSMTIWVRSSASDTQD